MATYDLRNRIPNQYPYDSAKTSGGSPIVKVSKIVDASAAAVVKGSALTTADIMQMIVVPANSLILSVFINVLTAEGAACTIDVGDGGSASRYANDLDVNATGATVYSTPYSVGTSDIDIRVTTNTAATDAFVAELTVVYVDMTCSAQYRAI